MRLGTSVFVTIVCAFTMSAFSPLASASHTHTQTHTRAHTHTQHAHTHNMHTHTSTHTHTHAQTVFGLERIVDMTIARKVPQVAYASTVGIRFINNIIGV